MSSSSAAIVERIKLLRTSFSSIDIVVKLRVLNFNCDSGCYMEHEGVHNGSLYRSSFSAISAPRCFAFLESNGR